MAAGDYAGITVTLLGVEDDPVTSASITLHRAVVLQCGRQIEAIRRQPER